MTCVYSSPRPIFLDPDAQYLFWTPKPTEVSYWDWLFHQANPNRFPDWVADLLNIIIKLSQITGRTWCYQQFLATRLGKSVRWIRETLHRLEAIGVIEIVHDRQNRYRITDEFQTERPPKGRRRGRSAQTPSDSTSNPGTACTSDPTSGPTSGPTSDKNPTDLPVDNSKKTGYPTQNCSEPYKSSCINSIKIINQDDDQLSDVRAKVDTGANRRSVETQKTPPLDNEKLKTATQIVAIREELHRLGKSDPVNNPDGYARHLCTHDPAILKTEHERQRALLDAARRERAALAVGTYVPPTTETETTAPTNHTPQRQWDDLPETERMDWVSLAEEHHPEIKRMAKQRNWSPALLRETLCARAQRMYYEYHQYRPNQDGDDRSAEPMTNDEGHDHQRDNGCERPPSRRAPDQPLHHYGNLQPGRIRRDDSLTRPVQQADPG